MFGWYFCVPFPLPATLALIFTQHCLCPFPMSLSRLAGLWRVLALHHPQVFSTTPTPACLICSSSSLPVPIGLHLKSHGEGCPHLHPSLRVLGVADALVPEPVTLQLFLVLLVSLGLGVLLQRPQSLRTAIFEMLRNGSLLTNRLRKPNGNPGKIYISSCDFGGEGNIDCIFKKRYI